MAPAALFGGMGGANTPSRFQQAIPPSGLS
jgi:hypothetical protein